MKDSILANGPGGSGENGSVNSQTGRFGNLPPHLRDRVQQTKLEGFPKGFEALLEEYYLRLATGADSSGSNISGTNNSGSNNNSAGPASKPAETASRPQK
ncbi:MAG: hypothetical protein HY286_17730 [Planctomycetes bacterium]|nr:hypothetical protein [Planctomycetota bacterium]